MQLKKASPLIVALAAATSTLLGSSTNAQASEEADWEVEASALYYHESDDRVQDASISLRAARTTESGQVLILGLTADTLTGATPTGAVPLNLAQTFARPSEKGSYTTPAGETPTDDTFKDSRVAGYISWRQPLAESWASTLGLSFSDEYDYLHIGANASLSKEFNRKNTVLNIGASFARDTIDPEGGVPIALAAMRAASGKGDDDDDDEGSDLFSGPSNKTNDSEDKNLIDLIVGITQVIDRDTIAQFNYSFSYVDGYQTDPYKFLSVLDTNTGLPVAGSDSGMFLYLYENRPEKRTKHSFFTKVKRAVGNGFFDVSYRYMTDDWGIDSHTIDSHYHYNISSRHYIEPHIRWYQQTAADFYSANLVNSQAVPQDASADYRLAKFTGVTLGMKYGYKLSENSELSARVEWYKQYGTSRLMGVPTTENVFPGLDAGIVQVSYRLKF